MPISELETRKLFVGSSNVRKFVGNLTELRLSIEKHGVLQPLLARPVEKRFEVVIGSERFKASQLEPPMKTLPVIVKSLTDAEALAISLVENIQRHNLELEEEAEGILRLMRLDPKSFPNIKAVSGTLGNSESAIREVLDAYDLTVKLRSTGMKIQAVKSPSEEQRQSGGVIPLKHAGFVAAALKSERVKALSKREREDKTKEIVRTIAPLHKDDARRVVNRFRNFPRKSIARIKQEALSSWTVHLEPRTARALAQAAEKGRLSEEQIIVTALEKWLMSRGFLK